jgi:hypothetical protein
VDARRQRVGPGVGKAAPTARREQRPRPGGRSRCAVSTRRAPEGIRTPNLLIRSWKAASAVLTCGSAVQVRAYGSELDAVTAITLLLLESRSVRRTSHCRRSKESERVCGFLRLSGAGIVQTPGSWGHGHGAASPPGLRSRRWRRLRASRPSARCGSTPPWAAGCARPRRCGWFWTGPRSPPRRGWTASTCCRPPTKTSQPRTSRWATNTCWRPNAASGT